MIQRCPAIGLVATLAVVMSGCSAAADVESKSADTPTVRARPYTGRALLVLLDLSLSFGNMADANRKLSEVAAALGPGDEFVLVRFGGPFDEARNVAVDSTMPPIPPDLLLIAPGTKTWKEKQRRLNSIWVTVDKNRRAIEGYLPTVKLKAQLTTPLDDALNYASTRLAKSQGERHLLILSDLIQDSDGVKRDAPPNRPLGFEGAHVRALFVPWRRDWPRREAEWGAWFRQSRAVDFHMFDGSQSRGVRLIPMSGAARLVPGRTPGS